MFGYVLQRAFFAVLTIAAISILSFIIIQLPPGDYLTSYIAQLQSQGDAVSFDQIEGLRKQYGLDRPLHVQYLFWVRNMIVGDFGVSLTWNRPVSELIGERLVLTVVVALSAIIFMWILALPIGIYSAVRQYSIGDYAFTLLGFIGLAVPDFLLALVLMYVGFAWFGTPVGGLFSQAYLGEETSRRVTPSASIRSRVCASSTAWTALCTSNTCSGCGTWSEVTSVCP